MKVLNLYAGVGGNRKLWNADVTAVESHPKIAEIYKAKPGTKQIKRAQLPYKEEDGKVVIKFKSKFRPKAFDKDNKVKDNPTFDFNGWCVLIPQGNTTITSGKNITTIDSGFKVGVMQTYLKGAKSTICEYVKINGKKVNSLIKK